MTAVLTQLELKLLYLALNREAAPGEVSNGAQKFVESLRRRGVDAIQIERALSEAPLIVKPLKPDYGRTVMIWGRHKGRILADIPPRDLRNTVEWARSVPEVARKFATFIHDIEAFLNQT
ncbi:MAG: hypothetical protein DME55_07650 [Verrucomicrobia bacterium]|nr:MAG: hypothetical protein DME55_07650 [Verrucomicrobiota bacterium]